MLPRVLGAWCLVLGAAAGADAQTLDRRIHEAALSERATWVAYRVPMAGAPRRMCCFELSPRPAECCGQCRLDGGDGVVLAAANAAAASRLVLEPPTDMHVFVRVENGTVGRVRTFSPDCDIDAGGMPVVWLDDVAVDDSVRWLASFARTTANTALEHTAITILALHPGRAAVQELIAFARDDPQPGVRRHAFFWLGRSPSPDAIRYFEEILRREPGSGRP